MGSCIEVGDEAVTLLVTNCKEIRVLLLPSLCKITTTSLEAIANNCKELTELDVSWCRFVDDDILDLFFMRLRNLTTITLWGCSRVTHIGVGLYRKFGKIVHGKC